uniref:influenza virus NS1A-binding protein homolog n=1 Tax=Ciona intestinalis TaxID=7719 RepID=UPI00006A5FC0|nr:influenza virus NS1A-binding protein homolog [Ciona intestinalis]|eukprot:XP_002129836.1 influenza virus NS1A-binding protein homolog [Ciona intestinalis]
MEYPIQQVPELLHNGAGDAPLKQAMIKQTIIKAEKNNEKSVENGDCSAHDCKNLNGNVIEKTADKNEIKKQSSEVLDQTSRMCENDSSSDDKSYEGNVTLTMEPEHSEVPFKARSENGDAGLSKDDDLHRQSDVDADDSDIEEDMSKEFKTAYKKSHQPSVLEWTDTQHHDNTIHRLDVFRKSKHFCDLVLQVGGKEIYCHRVVVGGAARSIFDELSRGEQEVGNLSRIPLDGRNGLLADAVEILIDYIYTAKLVIPSELLTAVYKACLQLGVERVTPLCRRYIIADLEPEHCVPMRRLASSVDDMELKQYIDNYIEENFEAVAASNELLNLPRIKIEIVMNHGNGVISMLLTNLREGSIGHTALAWVRYIIEQRGGRYFEDLTEQVQRIPLDEINNTPSSASGFHGNNYNRKLSHDEPRDYVYGKTNGAQQKIRLSRSSSIDSISSSDSDDSNSRALCCMDGEWSVIATTPAQGSDHVISLCSVGGVLCTLSIRLPNNGLLNGNETNGFATNATSSVSSASTTTSCSSSVASVSPLGQLAVARCAAGVAQLQGKLIVAGGFNQSECLDTVECFDSSANRWSPMSRMSEKRARFAVAVLRGHLYAVGGSSGSHDHVTVEKFDPTTEQWCHVQSLKSRCSEASVAVLNNLLYCVGGVQKSTGVVAIKTCQVYDPSADEWSYKAQMHTGRSSLGVAALGSHLFAVGGSDGWTCLNTAEKYDPVADRWTFTAALNVQRRGLGMAEHNGALYSVGGFDGTSFLSSVERYNPEEADVWVILPSPLGVPRNNAGLASLHGTLYIVGGFSGRHFLSTVEALDDVNGDWTAHDIQSLATTESESD